MTTYTTKPVVVDNLFDDETYATVLRWINDYVPLMPLPSDRDEPASPRKFGRRYAHNLPFLVEIHRQLRDYASEIFGEPVKPSYVFLSMYDKGGRCPLHIDRPQCRYTIDYLIRQEQKSPWSIKVGPQMSDEEVAVIEVPHPTTKKEIKQVVDSVEWTTANLQPNSAVCYSGTHCWHYRPDASKGTADLAFFHFVPEAFDGSLD